MRNSPTLLLCAFVCIFSTSLQFCAQADNRNLIVQTTPTDCGPAALATLLHYYLGIRTTEQEMVRLSGATPEFGTTLLGLQKAAQAKGCAADSFRMTYATLQKQLATFAAPVIVNLLNTQPHFALVVEAGDEYVFLADPAFGNIVLRKKEFLRYWTSPVIVPRTQASAGSPEAAAEGFVFIAASDDEEAGRAPRREAVQRLQRQLQNLQASRRSPAGLRR